jgi:hypothetical protein
VTWLVVLVELADFVFKVPLLCHALHRYAHVSLYVCVEVCVGAGFIVLAVCLFFYRYFSVVNE